MWWGRAYFAPVLSPAFRPAVRVGEGSDRGRAATIFASSPFPSLHRFALAARADRTPAGLPARSSLSPSRPPRPRPARPSAPRPDLRRVQRSSSSSPRPRRLTPRAPPPAVARSHPARHVCTVVRDRPREDQHQGRARRPQRPGCRELRGRPQAVRPLPRAAAPCTAADDPCPCSTLKARHLQVRLTLSSSSSSPRWRARRC